MLEKLKLKIPQAQQLCRAERSSRIENITSLIKQNLYLLLLINYWRNFILTLQTFMSPLRRSHLRLSNMKLAIMTQHM
jgi:hypothetical protein